MPTLTTIIQHSFGSASHSNQRRKRNIRNTDQKRIKTLFADNMIPYTENIKDAIRNLLELIIDELVKLQDAKLIHREKILPFLCTNNEKSERGI